MELPPAGIDKTTLHVHPLLIANFSVFHPFGNNNNCVQFRIPKYSCFYSIEFHAEFFNPYQNYLDQIITYLVSLVSQGILYSPINTNLLTVDQYFRMHFSHLFSISMLEFYFDFRKEDMRLNPKNPYYKKYHGQTTFSADMKKGDKSSLTAYNREKSLLADGNKSHEAIKLMPNKKRLEFRLTQRTCAYMHPSNLDGDYHSIVSNYLPFLARKWVTFGSQVAYVDNWYILNYTPYFQDLMQMAISDSIPRPGKFLKKTPPNRIPKQTSKCKTKKEQVDPDVFVRLTTDRK
jgi:hypothetical protein